MATDMSQALFAALRAGAKVATGGRVNHARGLLVEGHFRATATAPQFCMAAVFGGEDQRVVARFSSSGANPHIDQRSPAGEPRGLALRIGNKAGMVLIGHSLEGFPASDPEAFLAFLNAVNAAYQAYKAEGGEVNGVTGASQKAKGADADAADAATGATIKVELTDSVSAK